MAGAREKVKSGKKGHARQREDILPLTPPSINDAESAGGRRRPERVADSASGLDERAEKPRRSQPLESSPRENNGRTRGQHTRMPQIKGVSKGATANRHGL